MIRTINIRGPMRGDEPNGIAAGLNPTDGYKMRILGGIISHVTATNTYLGFSGSGFAYLCEVHHVDNAVASARFALNDRVTTNVTISVELQSLWIYPPSWLLFFGDANSGCDLIVEEIPLTEEEQKRMRK